MDRESKPKRVNVIIRRSDYRLDWVHYLQCAAQELGIQCDKCDLARVRVAGFRDHALTEKPRATRVNCYTQRTSLRKLSALNPPGMEPNSIVTY